MGAAQPDGPPHEGNQHAIGASFAPRTRSGVGVRDRRHGFDLSPRPRSRPTPRHVGVGHGLRARQLLYGPAKMLLAMLGTFTAGLGYAVTAGDVDVARKILDSSVMGDYVLEPAHITGQKTIEFIGGTMPEPADDWGTPPPTAENSGFYGAARPGRVAPPSYGHDGRRHLPRRLRHRVRRGAHLGALAVRRAAAAGLPLAGVRRVGRRAARGRRPGGAAEPDPPRQRRLRGRLLERVRAARRVGHRGRRLPARLRARAVRPADRRHPARRAW